MECHLRSNIDVFVQKFDFRACYVAFSMVKSQISTGFLRKE